MKFGYYGKREPKEELVYDLLLNNPPELLALDVECVSLKHPDPVGIAIATSPTDAFYFPIQPEPSSLLPNVLSILSSPSITKIMHNSLFDLRVMPSIDKTNIIDTLIMAHMAGLRRADLSTVAAIIGKLLPQIPDFKEWIWEWSLEQIMEKCCSDAQAAFEAYHYYKSSIDMDYLKTEMKLIPILLSMSSKGIRIDSQLRAEIEIELENELILYESLAEEMGFNPGSPKQVAYMLAKDKVFLPLTRSRKSLRTDERTLRKINHPIASMVLAYRDQKTLYSRYIKPLRGYDRLHSLFHLDAITGRVSSGGSENSTDKIIYRNMQNIPKGRQRNIFIPDTGIFTDIDFSQIELRTLAYISQDDVMQSIFDSEGDIHQATADLMGTTRKLAKNTNFAFIYGATDETIMETAGVTSRDKAVELRTTWNIAYPKAGEWIAKQQEEALKAGYITTLYGRRIPLPSEMEERPEAIKRKAVNYPIQASAAEIVKRAMIICAEAGLLEPMRLQVHDELLFEGNVVKELQELDLEHIAPFKTPYNVKLLERWE